MLNQSDVVIKNGIARKTILVDEKNSTALSCVVSNTGVTADSDGNKIIKAGTPVSGSLQARNTAFKVVANAAAEGAATPVGIILHDVDVTNGDANSQVVIFGTIDISKLDAEVVTMVNAAAGKLKMIQFVK